jgi:hypothetical protein
MKKEIVVNGLEVQLKNWKVEGSCRKKNNWTNISKPPKNDQKKTAFDFKGSFIKIVGLSSF